MRLLIEVLSLLNRVFLSTSCLAPIVGKVLGSQCQYYSFPATHCVIKLDPFPAEPTVWISRNTPSQPSVSLTVNPQTRLHSAPHFSMRIEPTGAPSATQLQQSQPTVQVNADINANILQTAGESERPL